MPAQTFQKFVIICHDVSSSTAAQRASEYGTPAACVAVALAPTDCCAAMKKKSSGDAALILLSPCSILKAFLKEGLRRSKVHES